MEEIYLNIILVSLFLIIYEIVHFIIKSPNFDPSVESLHVSMKH